jgi:nucleotide-binding universal stress UspA family protein
MRRSRQSPAAPGDVTGTYRSILVAYDSSPEATAALRYAVELARRDGAWLTLMHVIGPPKVYGGYPGACPLVSEEHEPDVEAQLDAAAATVPEGVPVHTIVRHGEVAAELLRRVETAQHDLVVIGRRSDLRPGVLGSVSRRVANRCPAAVLVVHAADARALADAA